jgi:spermidine/putrescine-binding protein
MKKNRFSFKKIAAIIMMTALVIPAGGCGKAAAVGEITVINYGEYLDPDMLDLFTKETGIKVNYEEAITPEEMYTKYSSGAIKYDLVCSSDYMMKKMILEGDFQEIPWDAMENKDNIGDKFYEFSSAFDPGNKYCVPYFWGTLGILYDTTKVKGPVDSWDVLFNGEYAGDIIMQNSMKDTFMVALKYLGYSVNTDNPDELKEAQQLLLAQKPDVQAYLVDEARDEVVAGNAAMAVVYSGEAYLGHEYNNDLAYVVPKEGSNVWIDCWAITKECEHPEYAAKFLDFLCREDVGMTNFEYIYYSTPNEKVVENMDEELRNDESIVPSDASVEKCEVCVQVDDDVTALMNELWKELKSE